ncbi:hypothetical protein OA099_03355 [Litorivicinus sp.]|nr:hypothetical protein [Litorivicinus sp.]
MSSPQPVSDFWVRFGHWLIVLGVVFQQFSGEELKRIDTDTSVGLFLSGSVVFRLARGFVGPKHARFWIFIKKTE